MLSVEHIRSRLETSFGLLAGGGRNTLPRQRTLGAAIDWSHDLLSEKERVLFRRLSVFAAGFELDAAEEVCGGETLERGEILDRLTSLIGKSLVEVAERGGTLPDAGDGREKLDASGEAERVLGRHARHYLNLAEEAEPEPGELEARLELEHDNLRTALSWALGTKETELGLRLAAALWSFRYTRLPERGTEVSGGCHLRERSRNHAGESEGVERRRQHSPLSGGVRGSQSVVRAEPRPLQATRRQVGYRLLAYLPWLRRGIEPAGPGEHSRAL